MGEEEEGSFLPYIFLGINSTFYIGFSDNPNEFCFLGIAIILIGKALKKKKIFDSDWRSKMNSVFLGLR